MKDQLTPTHRRNDQTHPRRQQPRMLRRSIRFENDRARPFRMRDLRASFDDGLARSDLRCCSVDEALDDAIALRG